MFYFLLPLSKKIISLIFPLSEHGVIALYLFKLKIQNLYLLIVHTSGHSFVIYVQVHIDRILYIYRMCQFKGTSWTQAQTLLPTNPIDHAIIIY